MQITPQNCNSLYPLLITLSTENSCILCTQLAIVLHKTKLFDTSRNMKTVLRVFSIFFYRELSLKQPCCQELDTPLRPGDVRVMGIVFKSERGTGRHIHTQKSSQYHSDGNISSRSSSLSYLHLNSRIARKREKNSVEVYGRALILVL